MPEEDNSYTVFAPNQTAMDEAREKIDELLSEEVIITLIIPPPACCLSGIKWLTQNVCCLSISLSVKHFLFHLISINSIGDQTLDLWLTVML